MTTTKEFEYKTGLPTGFDGDHDNSREFIQSCNLCFDINEKLYTTDKQKIIFITSFMTEKNAKSWKEQFLDHAQSTDTSGQKVGYGTLQDFMKSFKEAFEPVDTKGTALTKLRDLKQGSGDLHTYIADFEALAAKARITDDATKIQFFQDGLNLGILTKLFAPGDVSEVFHEVVLQCVCIDNSHHRLQAI
jgi:Retrotransposon gag protein